jgi:hypothetical protein
MKKKISWLIMFLFLFTSLFSGLPQTARADEIQSVQTSFEAESPLNEMTGGANISSDDSASGKLIANNINYQTSVTFKNINVQTAGDYHITLCYVSGAQRNFTMSVNGAVPSIVTCPAVHDNDWSSVGQITVPITLKAGNNDIKFSCDDTTQWGPNLDRIILDTVATQPRSVFEAESPSNIMVGAQISGDSKASGAYIVSNMNNNTSVTFKNINIQTAGNYNITLYYVSGDPRNFTMSVNGGDAIIVPCPAVNADWSTVGEITVPISLIAGKNNIKFSSDGYGPNLDKISLDVVATQDQPVQTSLEAESPSNTITGDIQIKGNNLASGKFVAGNINHWTSLTFKNINISKEDAGTRNITLYYVSGAQRYFTMSVNGGTSTKVACPAVNNGDWSSVGYVTVPIDLVEGKNDITFSCDDTDVWGPDLDRIILHGVVTTQDPPAVQSSFEAESASNDTTGDVTIGSNDLASGKAFANNINYQTSITFRNINVASDGTYMVTLYYISGQDRNFQITTNNDPAIVVTCPMTHDNDWSSVGQITITLKLKAGNNDIKFSCDSTTQWGPNLDRIVINNAVATQGPPAYPTYTGTLYEAESADNTFDGATVVDSPNVHAGKYVKVDNSPGLTFNKVHADEDGYYTLTVLYAAGDNNRLIYLTTNGVDVVKIKTPSTGFWDKIGKAQAVVHLYKGDNTLAFRNIDAGYPDIWAPYLDAITITPGAVGPAPVPVIGDSYEAETAELGSGAVVQDNTYSSGSKQVGNIGGANNGSVTFKDVAAASDGNYTLSLFYVTALSSDSFRIKINDKAPMLISCIKTDMNGQRSGRIDVNVTLSSGKNTIKIDNQGLSSPQLDRIVVNKGNTVYEAEARINTLLETADKTDSTKASGAATIGNLGGDGSKNGAVTINGITVDKTGKYLLKIYYISGSERAFDVSVNSLPAIRVICPAVATDDWSNVGSIEIPVTLTAGLNTINFDNRTGYAPQLDKIEIGYLSDATVPAGDSNIINLTGGKVKIAYNLATGTADYYSDGVKKISGFYAAVKQVTGEDMSLTSGLITSKMYTTHTAETVGNETIITSTKVGYPTMKQHFTLVGGNYFLTQVELVGTTLSSNWMSPMMTDTTGSVDIGSYSDERALFVPYDNDAWTRYNAKPINGLSTSYEVSAFYDNTSRNGLVTGSVTHDTWKTGIYSSGSFNKLDKLYVYGGASTGSNGLVGGTHDVSIHGSVTGEDIYSPKIFVGFYSDWRDGMDEFADANTAVVSKLNWEGKVPFGWNSWGKLQSNLTYDKAIAVSNFIHDSLQNNNFNDDNVVYVNLDSYWDNMTDVQLKQFVDNCKANGQKAGIYWTPYVDWGSAATTLAAPGSAYTYNDIWLKNSNGNPIYNNGSKVVDPTHPGTRDRMDYFVKRFLDAGFEFLKLDFLTHGSMEGVHYDKTVQTGTQAFNQGMAYLLKKLDGKMFISESIAPMFPYQYGHSRRVACDSFGSINESEYTLNASTYGWWSNDKLYKFNDPDEMVFEGYTPNENITRVNSAVVTGTVFLNGDDLSKPAGQTLAKKYLTNPQVNAVAKKGKAFKAVEDNTGNRASDEFVMQDGSDYYLAVFNYGSSDVTKTVDFHRAGIDTSKKYTVTNLWDNSSTTEALNMSVALSANESKLLKLTATVDNTAPYFDLIVNGKVLNEGGSFDDYLPITFKVGDSLSGVASAKITIDGTDYIIDPKTQSSIDIDLAGKALGYTAVIVAMDNAGNRLEKKFSFTVTTSIDSMKNLIDRYVKLGKLSGALVVQLTNSLDQAQHQLDIGKPNQAIKHEEDFVKHLNNKTKDSYVSDDVKSILNADAKVLINK